MAGRAHPFLHGIMLGKGFFRLMIGPGDNCRRGRHEVPLRRAACFEDEGCDSSDSPAVDQGPVNPVLRQCRIDMCSGIRGRAQNRPSWS